jgi:Na+/proline symporter
VRIIKSIVNLGFMLLAAVLLVPLILYIAYAGDKQARDWLTGARGVWE